MRSSVHDLSQSHQNVGVQPLLEALALARRRNPDDVEATEPIAVCRAHDVPLAVVAAALGLDDGAWAEAIGAEAHAIAACRDTAEVVGRCLGRRAELAV